MDGRVLGQMISGFRNAWARGECLHPLAPDGCDGRPINSHTLQRSRILESIANDGHVLTFRSDIAALFKQSETVKENSLGNPMLDVLQALKSSGAFEPRRIGISDASIFPGFCRPHDHDTFAPIEEEPLVFNDHQCFLLAYRAVCMEFWAKKSKLQSTDAMIQQQGETEYWAEIRHFDELALSEVGGLKRDFDASYKGGYFSDVKATVFRLDASPQIATTGAFAPEVSFQGDKLQDIEDEETTLQLGSYCLLPFETEGFAFLGWLGEKPAVASFAESFTELDPGEQANALLRLSFESFENTYVSPAWWEGLEEQQKGWCRFRHTTGSAMYREISYQPDGMNIASFGLTLLRHG